MRYFEHHWLLRGQFSGDREDELGGGEKYKDLVEVFKVESTDFAALLEVRHEKKWEVKATPRFLT